jgi:hypothetical protein
LGSRRHGDLNGVRRSLHGPVPFVAGLLPVIGLYHFTDEWLEWLLIAVTAMVGVIGHLSAYRRHHHHAGPATAFVVKPYVIVGARLAVGDTLLEPAALAIGGLTAAGAHWANIHLCRCCARHPTRELVHACVELRRQPGGHDSSGAD